jgi:hypothetical protein
LRNSAAQTLEGNIISGFRLNSETKFGKERQFAEKNSPINAGGKTCFIALLFSLAFSFPAEVPLLIFKLKKSWKLQKHFRTGIRWQKYN